MTDHTPLWRLLCVQPLKEFSVLAELRERRLEGYVPAEDVWRGPAARRVSMKRALLPGYVFANVSDLDAATICHLPDAIRLLRITAATDENARTAAERISQQLDRFVTAVRLQEANGDFDHTRKRSGKFSVGQRVKIVKGMFAGQIAVFSGIRNDGRADLLLSFAMGTTGPIPLTLDKIRDAEAA